MSSLDPLAVLEIDARNEVEALLMEFDDGWQVDSLEAFCKRLDRYESEKFRTVALVELVKIDLQRSWGAGNERLIEDYLDSFPQLGNLETVESELIAAEYGARRGVDAELCLAEYGTRFPAKFAEVKRIVRQLVESKTEGSPSPFHLQGERAQASIDTSRVDA
ncbi:MAG: hypothetical protein AAGJ83_08515, partial [Planctomycetota bacterium]